MIREPISPRVRHLPWATGVALLVGLGLSSAMPWSLFAADLPGVASYLGIHPLVPHAGAFCYIDVRHVHRKRPSDLRVYRVLPNETYLFVGDPVALGYVGPTKAYFGPHPLDVGPSLASPEKVFCYIRGPHFHAQESPPSGSFASRAGVYWFMEQFPPEFGRDSRYLWINESGVIESYHPPTVSLADAPAGYRFPPEAEVQPSGAMAAPTPGKEVAKPGLARGKVSGGAPAAKGTR